MCVVMMTSVCGALPSTAPLLRQYHDLCQDYTKQLAEGRTGIARQLLPSPSVTATSLLHRLEGCHDNSRVCLRAELQMLSCNYPTAVLAGIREYLAESNFNSGIYCSHSPVLVCRDVWCVTCVLVCRDVWCVTCVLVCRDVWYVTCVLVCRDVWYVTCVLVCRDVWYVTCVLVCHDMWYVTCVLVCRDVWYVTCVLICRDVWYVTCVLVCRDVWYVTCVLV